MAWHWFLDSASADYRHPRADALPERYHRRFADEFLMLQYERVRALLPLMLIAVVVLVWSAAASSPHTLSFAERFGFPIFMIVACFHRYMRWRGGDRLKVTAALARSLLQFSVFSACILVSLSAIWCIYLFTHSDDPRKILAPVFFAAATLVTANCMASYPRAATVTLMCGSVTIGYLAATAYEVSMWAMAVSIISISILQVKLGASNFDEMATGLALRIETERLAETDALTGADNRRRFTQVLEAELSRVRTGAIEGGSIAMIDLNGFKPVNDNHGHAAGDHVLVEVAVRLRTMFATAPSIARIGGDEFAILFGGDHTDDTARVRADAIRAVLSLPYVHHGISITLSASVGIARFERDGNTVSALMQTADHALYAEKGIKKAPLALSA